MANEADTCRKFVVPKLQYFDAELKALEDKARDLKARKVQNSAG